MKAHQGDYGTRTMCRVLGVSPSGYYDWTKRGPSDRDLDDAYLTNEIYDLHVASRGTYGAPRHRR